MKSSLVLSKHSNFCNFVVGDLYLIVLCMFIVDFVLSINTDQGVPTDSDSQVSSFAHNLYHFDIL